MPVRVYRDDREKNRRALQVERGLSIDADLAIARYSENVDLAEVLPGSPYHSTCLILSGAMERVDRSAPLIGRGTLTVEPPEFEGRFTNRQQTEWLTVFIRTDRLVEMAEAEGKANPNAMLRRAEAEVDPVLAAMIQACAASTLSARDVTRIELDGWAQVIGSHFLRRYSAYSPFEGENGTRLGARALSILLEIIEENIDGNLSLMHLARMLDMGTTRLNQGFREATGQSLHAYIIGRRVDRAKNLILHTGLGLAEIAVQAGFSSQAHMTTTLRQRLGITPGRLRREARGRS